MSVLPQGHVVAHEYICVAFYVKRQNKTKKKCFCVKKQTNKKKTESNNAPQNNVFQFNVTLFNPCNPGEKACSYS